MPSYSSNGSATFKAHQRYSAKLEADLSLSSPGPKEVPQEIREIEAFKTEFLSKEKDVKDNKDLIQRFLSEMISKMKENLLQDDKEIERLSREVPKLAELLDPSQQQHEDPWVKNSNGDTIRFSELVCRDATICEISREKLERYVIKCF